MAVVQDIDRLRKRILVLEVIDLSLTALREEFPGWSSWASDSGHLYATRRRALPLEAGRFRLYRMVDGSSVEELRAELLAQAEHQRRAEAVLGELS